MVVTTVVLVAGLVLLTDGHLAAFSNPCRHYGRSDGLSDPNVTLTQTIPPVLTNRTF